jgi:hypothetical protein
MHHGMNLIAAALVGLAAAAAQAAPITLADLNASAAFDPASPAIQGDWSVDGRDYLANQGFWYRVGVAGGEQPLAALGLVAATPKDTNFDGLYDRLTLNYGQQGLLVDVVYTLFGSEPLSGWSSLTQTITMRNTGTAPVALHFFQYADFDLSDADTIVITGGNTARQTAGPILLAETVDTPVPSQYRAALGTELLDSLGDALPTDLGWAPGPVTGNATWAFQWDLTVNPGDTLGISKVQHLETPEPATLSLLGAGVASLAARRIRRK